MPPSRRPAIERFMSFVVKTMVSEHVSTECWLWTGYLRDGGYAQFFDGDRPVRGHRWSYEYFVGSIPDGLEPDHTCRVRRCVNPEHLEPVTKLENIMRGESPSAKNARRTACPHGHPLDGRRGDGYRYCLTCNRERARIKNAEAARFRRLRR